MEKPISGIRHVTAIASNPQRNLDFYTEVLGFAWSNAQTRLEWIAANRQNRVTQPTHRDRWTPARWE